MSISNWMSWEGGVDLAAMTTGEATPNIIVHLARTVYTPFGHCAAGLLLIPDFADPTKPPKFMGFVAENTSIGDYFGPHIFAGTAFEQAPVTQATPYFSFNDASTTASIEIPGLNLSIQVIMSRLSAPYKVDRDAGENNTLPFFQQGIEQSAAQVELRINGTVQPITLPRIGITGGPPAVVAPCGIYGR